MQAASQSSCVSSLSTYWQTLVLAIKATAVNHFWPHGADSFVGETEINESNIRRVRRQQVKKKNKVSRIGSAGGPGAAAPEKDRKEGGREHLKEKHSRRNEQQVQRP